MDLYGHLRHCLPERPDKIPRRARREDSGHILDGEGVDAHRLLGLGKLHVRGYGVHGRRRVAYGALRMAAVFLHARYGRLEVARIVERVEHAEDVHPVLAGERDEPVHHVVGIVLVAEDVLPSQQHLKRSLAADLLYFAQALPGVLAQEPHAHVERGAAPALDGIVARRVDRLGDFEDVVGAHARRPKRLVGIAQRRVGNPNSFTGCLHIAILYQKMRLRAQRAFGLGV